MKLEGFCSRFHAFLEQKPETSQIFRTGQELLGELLSDARWFGGILGKLISDPAFLETQIPSVFPNEVTLYRSPDRSFSVLAFLWEPKTPCPIHDHSAWGIIGSLLHPVKEIRYRRLDDGKVEGYAELEELSPRLIEPGAMAKVLPLDQGIHQTGAAAAQLAISVGVYGRSIRKGYIHFFNPSEKTVVRAYPPKLHKQVLAIQTLRSNPDLWGEELSAVSRSPWLSASLAKELSGTREP